jgi:IclR family mhp operon transcriptional activator
MKVRGLSEGFEDAQWITEVATPALIKLTAEIFWPCDVLTPDGLKLVVRDSTHRIAPLSIERNVVRRELPLTSCASGLAYLAFVSGEERTMLLSLLVQSGEVSGRDLGSLERQIAETQERGFGLRQGGSVSPRTGAIALPIRYQDRVIGCINTLWMARVVSAGEGIERCIEPLRATQAIIEERLAAGGGVDRSDLLCIANTRRPDPKKAAARVQSGRKARPNN